MNREEQLIILDAFTSLVRTDYISLDDKQKLYALYNYYVDYYHKIPLVLQDQDNLIVGRRGTGKTTLFYKSYVECLNTWDEEYLSSDYKNTTSEKILPIYIDLNKCTLLSDGNLKEVDLHSAFLQELVKSLDEQINRFWPKSSGVTALLKKIFGNENEVKIHDEINQLARMLVEGKPFVAKRFSKVEEESHDKAKVKAHSKVEIAKSYLQSSFDYEEEVRNKEQFDIIRNISVGDVLTPLKNLKQLADISSIIIFIDEFSSLKKSTQRNLSNLLKSLLGNKSGIYFKISAITDNYDFKDILIPRDLTPISLDLDDVFEGAENIAEGIQSLKEMNTLILRTRMQSFLGDTVVLDNLFQEFDGCMEDLTRAAMGVPRTIGYALQKAWTSALAKNKTIMTRAEVMSGIKYVSSVYINTFLGAVKSGTLPDYQGDMWLKLSDRAQNERKKSKDKAASHFNVLPFREKHLSKLSEYLIVHLVKKARTTKNDTTKRNLYCFDYGLCNELNLGFSTDNNIIRQQRFIYDNELELFDKEFDIKFETTYLCRRCQVSYTKDQLYLEKLNIYLDKCPSCGMPLQETKPIIDVNSYTEEETKIIGSIYAENNNDGKYASIIADEVGCYVQKVARFAIKLDEMGIIVRKNDGKRYKYFAKTRL